MQLEDIAIHGLIDGESILPSNHFGVEGTPGHIEMLGADGLAHLPIASFLLVSGGKNILLDAGLGPRTVKWDAGNGHISSLEGGKLPESLAAVGFTPDDIDIVLLSHLHGDHMGWVWQDGKPFFPNATVRFGADEWGSFVDEAASGQLGAGIRALAELGKVSLIEHDGEVAPGVNSMGTPGHSPGHQSFILSAGKQRAIFLGDALACPVQIEAPELEALADMDAKMGIATRERILRELNDDDLVGGPHFPGLRFGRVLFGESGRYWN